MLQHPDGPDGNAPGRLFIGLMSGTSTDGVDGVLVRLQAGARPVLLASASLDMPEALGGELLALNRPGQDELARAALAGNALARLYAEAVTALLSQSGHGTADVTAIGAHGQTVRHRPELGYTVQLNNPALLAELSGIDVVADFRSRDVAAGGQGAPLVPPFHAAMFGGAQPRAVLNLGGIANLTLLDGGSAPRGFDTGPANMLLDFWCHQHTGHPYDDEGRWAATGHANADLLELLIADEPWFALPPPKSTGRDLFDSVWLAQRLNAFSGPALDPADVQATLQRLTARTVADALERTLPQARDVLVCGGGARNTGLMRDLADCLRRPVRPTDTEGVPAQWVEALAFAWLAQAHVDRLPASVPAVTGARSARVLGALYPH
ncbi:anhydro-N-acetylmuramic acid kinase [Bordetella ansorpii]|uniref:Anhydro-N-acetylmuramic acid kinase n=1 Tax=Bordetella ansorpii TaxID=288768 RepID=A0A157SQV2_9BORD|nr:anhydro-N-acetylmuramic acid kinase [Bordetella ansorpii]SAI72878.1 anhydro-N-acetylmuramic acid kinase [Bordetella ansorpii]